MAPKRKTMPRKGAGGRAAHDVGGLNFGKIDRSEHDPALWEKRTDAMQRLLTSPGKRAFSVDGLRRVIEDYGEQAYDRTTYYGPGDLECEGWATGGTLWAVKQFKLTFTPCGMETNGNGEPTWGEKVTYWQEIASQWGYGVFGQGCWFRVWTVHRLGPWGSCYFLYKY